MPKTKEQEQNFQALLELLITGKNSGTLDEEISKKLNGVIDKMMNLNDQQKRAIMTQEGKVSLITGKTTGVSSKLIDSLDKSLNQVYAANHELKAGNNLHAAPEKSNNGPKR
tara:strand:- start:1430 stop:1765 length:336 start_codon:yes stop_codon:yes gene_type:complete